MRTTVRLDDDVAAAADLLRSERNIGLSEAVNQLARAGLQTRPPSQRFRQRTQHVGLRLDISNVAEVLELLDEDDQPR